MNKLTDGSYGIFEQKDVRLGGIFAVSGNSARCPYRIENRRGFWEFYAEDREGCLQNSCASILICDVDFFKTINDTYGHALGRNQVRA